jgi:hypothetical protein
MDNIELKARLLTIQEMLVLVIAELECKSSIASEKEAFRLKVRENTEKMIDINIKNLKNGLTKI